MAIGAVLRRAGALATVGGRAACLNACLLVLAGATARTVDGRAGLRGATATVAALDGVDGEAGRRIAAYLHDMGVTAQLLADAKQLAAGQTRWLSSGELQACGLGPAAVR
jgi:hypothetical protein